MKFSLILWWPQNNIRKIFIPKKYSFFRKPKKIYWNLKFWTRKIARAYVCMKISEHPAGGFLAGLKPDKSIKLWFFIKIMDIAILGWKNEKNSYCMPALVLIKKCKSSIHSAEWSFLYGRKHFKYVIAVKSWFLIRMLILDSFNIRIQVKILDHWMSATIYPLIKTVV